MSSNIKALVFDCFGVLTSDGWLPYAEKYFGQNQALMQEARDLNKQVDSGMLDYHGFVFQVAKLASIDVSEAFSQIENNLANNTLFEYILQQKPQFKIGMLSNAGQNWLPDLFTPEQIALFDSCVFSYQLGVVKPDPKMYLTVCQQLGVEPSEAVFIDDNERFVTGAVESGMQGIVFKNNQQTITDLAGLLS